MTFDIRLAEETDSPALSSLSLSGGHSADEAYFRTAFAEQEDRKRAVFLLFADEILRGYVHLNFYPQYQPFLRLHIPEIQDLFVHPDFRRNGAGEALIRHCEGYAEAWEHEFVGIGVGVAGNFGAAQRLYARLGYLPDGAGAVFERVPVQAGEVRPIDDRLCLMLVKSLP